MVRLEVVGRVVVVGDLVVSIPYGSIRSVLSLLNLVILSVFQFLMVRLEVIRMDRFTSLTKFQFLMVRLEES